jgi:hypothetical protein
LPDFSSLIRLSVILLWRSVIASKSPLLPFSCLMDDKETAEMTMGVPLAGAV